MSKRAPIQPMGPIQYSLRATSHHSDIFDSHAEQRAADDAELRQFIMRQFSMQTSRVQGLLEGLEQRILDSVLAVSTVRTMSAVYGSPATNRLYTSTTEGSTPSLISPLRQGPRTEASTPSITTPEHLPGTLNSDHVVSPTPKQCKTPKLESRSLLCEAGSPQHALSPEISNGSATCASAKKAPEEKAPKPTIQVGASPEDNAIEERPRRMSRVEDEITQMAEFAKTMSLATSVVSRTSSMISMQQRCTGLINSRPAELLISFLILLNAMVIGAQVDSQMRNPSDNVDKSTGYRISEIVFTVVFLTELLFRMYAEKIIFFFSIRNPNAYWNFFDFCLVSSSIIEEMLNAMMDSTPDVSMLRLFRIVRLVRLFRIVRVMRFFQDLRIMVSGIAQSMQSLVWALLLLFCVMYLVAVCVLQFAAEEGMIRASGSGKGELSDNDYQQLREYFGSLARTLYTLYMSITGGLDWGQAADPLFAVGWVLGCFYIAYTAFSVLCVLNIVTGVFVENCNKMTAKDDELVYMEQMEQRRQWYDEVKEIFQTADSDNSGYLDAQEFSDKVEQDIRLRAWMRKIGVHVEAYSASGLFKLMDLDGDGLLDFDEFATALQQVHGQARSIDVAKVLHDTKMVKKLLISLAEKLAPECVSDNKFQRSPTRAMEFSLKMKQTPVHMPECESPESTDGNAELT